MGHAIRNYYAFQVGRWQFLSLNSEAPHGAGSAQLRWLDDAIRSTPQFGTCRIAYGHRPRYSAGTVHGDQPDMQPVWDALTGHASVVLAGHEHDMQRLAPREGITELISGAGGKDLYPLDPGYSRLRFGDDARYGALRLTLDGPALDYAFVDSSGEVLDSGRIGCDRAR
jgi:hypothetical protein